MNNPFPEQRFERLLLSLERELLATSDEEIAAVAAELGQKPDMKGSVALFGVTFAVDITRLKEGLKARAAAARPTPTPKRRPKDEPSR